jgi:polysaccharide biosynthesis/export protein
MTSRTVTFLILSLFVGSLIISCSSAPQQKKEVASPEAQIKEAEKEGATSRQVRMMNEKLLMSALSARRESYRDYRIGAEDLLEVSVFEEEKLNKAVRVSSQGNISLPLLGILRVKGLTSMEVEREIRDLLAEKYFQDPHVSVFIKEYRSQRISVMGAVEKPGVFEVTGQKTILDMLAMAGGLKAGLDSGAGQLLFLIRPPRPEDEAAKGKKESEEVSPRTFVIDLEELLIKGDLSLNMLLIHGDVISIPVSGKIFVGGEVRHPGGFPLQGKKMTLTQAITLAGGLKKEADGSETKILRYSDKSSEREILSFNAYALQKGEGSDPYLKENDIIVVPRHGFKGLWVEFLDVVKGIVGFGFTL